MTNEFPNNMGQLKPCPFCSSYNVIIIARTKDASWVQCNDCKSKGAFDSFTQEDMKTIIANRGGQSMEYEGGKR